MPLYPDYIQKTGGSRMDAYKSPESEIEDKTKKHQPIKGLIKSSLVATIILMLAGLAFMVLTALIFGVDLEDQDGPDSFMNTNITYMVLSLILSVVVLYQSGRLLGNHLFINFNEWAAGLVTVCMVVFYGPYLIWDMQLYSPVWYQVASFLSVPICIFLGVKSREKI